MSGSTLSYAVVLTSWYSSVESGGCREQDTLCRGSRTTSLDPRAPRHGILWPPQWELVRFEWVGSLSAVCACRTSFPLHTVSDINPLSPWVPQIPIPSSHSPGRKPTRLQRANRRYWYQTPTSWRRTSSSCSLARLLHRIGQPRMLRCTVSWIRRRATWGTRRSRRSPPGPPWRLGNLCSPSRVRYCTRAAWMCARWPRVSTWSNPAPNQIDSVVFQFISYFENNAILLWVLVYRIIDWTNVQLMIHLVTWSHNLLHPQWRIILFLAYVHTEDDESDLHVDGQLVVQHWHDIQGKWVENSWTRTTKYTVPKMKMVQKRPQYASARNAPSSGAMNVAPIQLFTFLADTAVPSCSTCVRYVTKFAEMP